jgi:hypothetical protein
MKIKLFYKNFKALLIISGINLASKVELNSKHGFVLISIK